MDYNINLQQQKDVYSPQTSPMNYNSTQFQNGGKYKKPQEQAQQLQEEKQSYQYKETGEAPSGITKFCQLPFYEQYFRVSQLDVTERIKLSFIPTKNRFFDTLGNYPDFYGPFWILTTIIFLLSSAGNLSRYFYNFEKDVYIFKLQLVRYGIMVVYSFGLGFPFVFHFVLKLLGSTRLSLPEIICIYGYSFSCFIPIFVLCILPFQVFQWLLIAYGTINTTLFLINNIKDYIQQLEPPKIYLVCGLIVGIQITLFLTFKLVFFKLVYETNIQA